MRMFLNFDAAHDEVKRDLAELGLKGGKTVELMNYQYSVAVPDYTEIPNVHEAFVEAEWEDRILGELNPGKAWHTRPDLWRPYLERDKGDGGQRRQAHFAFTNSQRMGGRYIQTLLADLIEHPESDDLFLPVWTHTDSTRRNARRVPTDIGYWFKTNHDALDLTYISRCTDFRLHFPNDVALAVMLQWYLAQKADMKVGYFHHFLCKLWANIEELEGVF